MATVYSNTSTSGYNDIRIKVDYSGTSATCTVQFKRNGSYGSYGWKDPNATLEFNGTTKGAGYGDPGYVSNNWVNLKTVSGYSISTSGGSYGWKLSKGAGASLSGSGTVNIPSQATPPTAPTISVAAASGSQINATWGTTNLGNPTGTVYLYNGTTSSPANQISSKTTTGNSTYNNTGLTANTTYYYKATASNTAGSASSSVVNATTYPAGISSITVPSITATSASVAVACANSGSALTTTLQTSDNGSSWSSTGYTNVQNTTKTISLTGLTANTSYTKYYRVNTTVGSSASSNKSFVTLPAGITSATAGNITETSAVVAVVCAASGSAKTTHLQISSDNSTWTDVATGVQGTTVNASITGLTPNTSVTRYFRIHTDAGNSSTVTVTFTTLKVAHFYGSVNGSSKRIKKLYGSVNGQTKTIRKVYASVNGQTKLIYRG